MLHRETSFTPALLTLLFSVLQFSNIIWVLSDKFLISHFFYLIAQSALIVILLLIFFYYDLRLSLTQIFCVIFFLCFLLLQALNGIAGGIDNFKILSTFLSNVFLIVILALSSTLSTNLLIKLIKMNLLISLFSSLTFECLNLVVSGNSFSIIFQNQYPLLLLSYMTLQYASPRSNQQSNLSKYFFGITLFFVISILFLAQDYRLQYKVLFSVLGFLIVFFVLLKGSIAFWLLKLSVIGSVLCLLIFNFNPIFSFAFGVRAISLDQRFSVFMAMIADIYETSSYFWGNGLGASLRKFDYFLTAENVKAYGSLPPHSGFAAMFYELGFIGTFFWFLSIFFLIYETRKDKIRLTIKYRNGLFITLILFWIWLNVSSIWVVPFQNYYYNTGIINFTLMCFLLYKARPSI